MKAKLSSLLALSILSATLALGQAPDDTASGLQIKRTPPTTGGSFLLVTDNSPQPATAYQQVKTVGPGFEGQVLTSGATGLSFEYPNEGDTSTLVDNGDGTFTHDPDGDGPLVPVTVEMGVSTLVNNGDGTATFDPDGAGPLAPTSFNQGWTTVGQVGRVVTFTYPDATTFTLNLLNATNTNAPFAFNPLTQELNIPLIDAPVNFVGAAPLAPTSAEALIAAAGTNPGTIIWSGGTVTEPLHAWHVEADGSVTKIESPAAATALVAQPFQVIGTAQGATTGTAVPETAEAYRTGDVVIGGADLAPARATGPVVLQTIGNFASGAANHNVTGQNAAVVGGEAQAPAGVQDASGDQSFIGGGVGNETSGQYSGSIAGFQSVNSGLVSGSVASNRSTASGETSAIIASTLSTASGNNSLAAASVSSTATGIRSVTIGANLSNNAGQNSIVTGNNNTNAVGGTSSLVSGAANTNTGVQSLVVGGANTSSGQNNIVGGGTNTNTGISNIVSGDNNVNGSSRSIVTGQGNTIDATSGRLIVNGINNDITGAFSTVVNGENNVIAGGTNNLIVGADNNVANSSTVMVTGQQHQVAAGLFNGYVGGVDGRLNHTNSWLYSTTAGSATPTIAPQSFTFAGNGGARFLTDGAGTIGAQLAPFATAWAAVSLREKKTDIEKLTDALGKVEKLGLYSFKYKDKDGKPIGNTVLGPMVDGEDGWNENVGSGEQDTITAHDMAALALAAVKELAERVTALENQ